MREDIWTASRLKTYQVCPMKEAFRYRENIAPIQTRRHLAFGTAIHKGLETRSIDAALDVLVQDYPKDQSEADAQDTASVAVRALLEGYFERYAPFDEQKPELMFKLPMRTRKGGSARILKIAGKLDNLVKIDGRWWVVEYKTASRLDGSYFDRLYMDDQITMYVYAMRRMGYDIAGVIYRVIRKPTLRKGAREGFEGFLERLEADIRERPDFYYTERKLYRSMDDLDGFEVMIYETASMANRNFRSGKCYRHSVSCSNYGACEYLPLCQGEEMAYNMFETREPNEELRKGNDNESANEEN